MKAKSLISLLASAAMTLSFMPTAAFAAAGSAYATSADQDSSQAQQLEEGDLSVLEGYDMPSAKELLSDADYVKGQATVLVRSGLGVQAGEKLKESMDVASSIKVLDASQLSQENGDYALLTVSSSKLSTRELIDTLNDNEDVVAAEPNYVYETRSITDDEYARYQWAMDNTGQSGNTSNAALNISNLWNEPSTTEDEYVLAICDVGVDYTHEDLADMMWVNPFEIPNNGIDDDGNGYIDDIHGASTENENKGGDPAPAKGETHGTHCSGIMLAKANNGIGIAGVDGTSSKVKLMALNIATPEGDPTSYGAVKAYDYIYDMQCRGINVVAINNSWGGGSGNSIIFDQLVNRVGAKGALSIIATGNEFKDMDKDYDMTDYVNNMIEYNEQAYDKASKYEGVEAFEAATPSYPAGINSDYVVRVTSTDLKGNISAFANSGSNYSDIAAPGSDILSTVSEETFLPNIYEDVESRTSYYKTSNFSFKVNTGYGTGSEVTIDNNSTEAYFETASGDNHCALISIKDAKVNTPYVVEMEYETSAYEQAPYLNFDLEGVQVPEESACNSKVMHINYQEGAVENSPLPSKWVINSGIFEGTNVKASLAAQDVWRHHHYNTGDKGTKRLIRFIFVPKVNGDYKIALDNIGLSTGKTGEENTFGKYDYMSGTSMACPTVCAAAGLLYEKLQVTSALQLKEALLSATTQSSNLDMRTIRALQLDLSKYGENATDRDAIPYITSTDYQNGVLVIKGENLKDSQFSLDGKVYPLDINTNEKVAVNIGEVENQKWYTARLDRPAGHAVTRFLGTSGKPYEGSYSSLNMSGADHSLILEDYNFASDGKAIYKLSAVDGAIVTYEIDKSDGSPRHLSLSKVRRAVNYKAVVKVLGKSAQTIYDRVEGPKQISSFMYAKNSVYFTANLVKIKNTDAGPYDYESVKSAVVRYNLLTGKTTCLEVPENVFEPALGMLNGKLVLAGGYNSSTKKMLDTTYVRQGKTWKAAAKMPQSRFLGRVTSYDGKLYYSGGTNGGESCPSILIYDGSTWRTSNSGLSQQTATSKMLDGVTYPYYECGVSAVKGGLLFTDQVFDLANGSSCDTAFYNASQDTASDYGYYYRADGNCMVRGCVVGDRYIGCGITLKDFFLEQHFSDEYTYGKWTKGINETDQSFPVEGDFSKVTTSDKLPVRYAGIGYCKMGDTITVSADASDCEEDVYVNALVINGKTYKGNQATFKVDSEKVVIKSKLKNSNLKNAKIKLQKKKYKYNGKEQKPYVTVKMGSRVLCQDEDFYVTYKNNKKVGKAKVIVEGAGEFVGKRVVKFKIVS